MTCKDKVTVWKTSEKRADKIKVGEHIALAHNNCEVVTVLDIRELPNNRLHLSHRFGSVNYDRGYMVTYLCGGDVKGNVVEYG